MMHLTDTDVEKSREDVQVENVVDIDPISNNVKVEGEIFPGINTQTIFAFLVSIVISQGQKRAPLIEAMLGNLHPAECLRNGAVDTGVCSILHQRRSRTLS